MKRYTTISLATGLLLTLSSCSKFLDIKPYDRTIPETPEDFSAIIHEMCDEIDGSSSTPVGVLAAVVFDAAYTVECWTDNLETNLTEYPVGNMLPTYVGNYCGTGSFYSNCYSTISRCNIVIDNLKQDTDTQETKDILGTAYALRGICYYQLLRTCCPPVGANDEQLGVPIVTEFDMEARPGRSDINTTIAQAESDMKKAMEYDIQNELYLFNTDLMNAYLARLYFWSHRYTEALAAALPLLEKYPLLEGTEYEDMMTDTNAKRGNMLFRTNTLSKGYSTQNSYLQARPISVRLIRLFPEGNNDIRYRLFVGKKRKNTKIFFAGLRSAELQLIAMESAYHIGETQTALKMLNELRSHRISDYEPYTMATLPAVDSDDIIKQDAEGRDLTPLIYAILNERRKELYLEGDRFYELKRNGRPEFWVTDKGLKYYTRQFMYTFALPASDIQLNPSLKQNPGYTEMKY